MSEVDGVDAADYNAELQVRRGDIFSPTLLERNIARLERLAVSRGLRFIRAEPRFTRDTRNGLVDVEFAIVRGERVFVERIDIQGNTTTRDEVIRRQFRVAEGDPLNPREIREAAERIRALGFFASSTVEPRSGSTPDQAVVDVEVEEKPTGSLGFSVSYGAQQGIGFGISFAEQNFLGRGQQVSASLNTVSGSRDISAILHRTGASWAVILLIRSILAIGRDVDLQLEFRHARSVHQQFAGLSCQRISGV